MQEQWSKISDNLRKTLDSGIFKVWILSSRPEVRENVVCLFPPNAFVADWLKKNMLAVLREAAAPVLGCEPASVAVRIEIAEQTQRSRKLGVSDSAGAADILRSRPAQVPLPITASMSFRPARWRHSFEDFVVGASNGVAAAAAQDVCRKGGSVHTLFVNSASGLGKTHLVHAVGQAITEKGADVRVGYLTAEGFATRFVGALRCHAVQSFKEELQEMDVLLLEDVHFFQGKEKMQEIALTVIKSLQARGGRLISTSSFSPREMQQMDSRLVSHFCSGILTAMDNPSRDMRRTILQRKAKQQYQVVLPEAVCEILVDHLCSDVRQLESCLDSLVFKARLLNSAISADLALEMIAQYIGVEKRTDMNALIRLVCESYGLSEGHLNSRSRRQECVIGRNTVYYLARKHTDLSLEQIGALFNRKHSTVIKGITSVEREISRDSTVGRQIAGTVRLIERNAGLAAGKA
ncbi:MAG: chromosomal replication initiator protein DnaA [Candidatus Desulfovibrio kirbyi]|uniref:Chromosomal replication initiator protein DnaA n=1 Tax=Candidatus Desulfovibrio kirbyi TaxID=2696086 RepID=A0A6L2R406_9BACT|nr:MAG: chromosomal replication initiator protein DnaA [Candidatus Desulfovibrio kirbyi]